MRLKCLFFVLCALFTTTLPAKEKTTTHCFEEYQITLPATWKQIPSQHLSRHLSLFSNTSCDPNFARGWYYNSPKGFGNMQCIIYQAKLTQKTNLDGYVDALIYRYGQQKSYMSNFKLLKRGDIMVSNTRGKWFDAMMQVGKAETGTKNCIFIPGKKIYYLYFSCVGQDFSKLKKEMHKIAQKFVIIHED